jgi:hypothetical protein
MEARRYIGKAMTDSEAVERAKEIFRNGWTRTMVRRQEK